MLEDNDINSIRELSIIIKISQSIISTLDYQEVLQIISDGMAELLDIESAAIYILENENDLLLSATTPALDPQLSYNLRKALLTDHPHIQQAILTQESVKIIDTKATKLSAAEKGIIEFRNLRSLLYFPFVKENIVLGVLILGTCNKSRVYSNHEIELGQTVANQLSIAIQNTRFHADLANYKRNLEELVAERTRKLETANKALRSLNEELQEKNEIVLLQKEELEATLNNLKTVQVKLFQSEKMASLGILTAGVAHEINNPLNFIMGAYEGLERHFADNAPERTETVSLLLKGLKTGVERASAIVQGLNMFSRDSNTLYEDCHLHQIIDNCLAMLLYQYVNHISIHKSYAKEELIVKGNIGGLHQVFINILTNSIQAIEGKGDIFVSTEVNNNVIKISVRDTGSGIEKENLQKIFDPFFTTKEPQKGIGLGLSIVFTIIHEHNGLIEFESEVNKGTTALITLPNNTQLCL